MGEAGLVLLGAVIGGLLTAGTTGAFEARRERRRRRMAARLLIDTLTSAQADLLVSLRFGRWTGLSFDPDRQALASLAESLGTTEWDTVSEACGLLHAMRRTYADRPGGVPLDDAEQGILDDLGRRAQRARDVLAAAAGQASGAIPARRTLEDQIRRAGRST